jgi:hypothetical protein
MIDEQLRVELLAMKAEDLRVREALLACGELSGPYAPQMEVVHKRNAEQLRKIIKIHGWPAEDVAGVDGAEAAWLIAQHAIGEPGFQKHALTLLESCAAAGRVPGWQAAYLKDRIAMCDGEAQMYGTQSLDDPRDGRSRPWRLADPEHVNSRRAEVGLPPLGPVAELGPELSPAERKPIEENEQWWKQWLASKGWRFREISGDASEKLNKVSRTTQT